MLKIGFLPVVIRKVEFYFINFHQRMMRRIVIERLITIGAREHKEDSLRFQIQISRCETERCEIEKLGGIREFFWLMEEFGLTVILKLLQGLQRPIRFAHSVLMRVGTWIKSKGLLVLFGLLLCSPENHVGTIP